MIRGIVTSALGGALLVAAGPVLAEKAPPRPARTDKAVRQAPAEPARPQAHREPLEVREATFERAPRLGPSLPHPFREQVRPEGRV